MDNTKKVVQISQGLVIFNALIWLVIGIAYLVRAGQLPGIPYWVILVMSIGMLGFGAILIGLGIGLATRRRFFFYAALTMIALSVILPIFDDFGLADLLAVLPAVGTVIYLSINKKTICGSQISGNQVNGGSLT
jgi:hypothetical protein